MTSVDIAPLPTGALLASYGAGRGYADCYAVSVARSVTLAQFLQAFYASPVFRVERWLLAHLGGMPSTDADLAALAQGTVHGFAAWQVESRAPDQVLLAAGRTRSWLMVEPLPAQSGTTRLYFGSAVVSRGRGGGMGWQFRALLGFHRLYSRVLLSAAARGLARA